jgi:hypothetical protein
MISLENKGNFFERKVTNYAKQTVLSKSEENVEKAKSKTD